jgi:hypothetical protein
MSVVVAAEGFTGRIFPADEGGAADCDAAPAAPDGCGGKNAPPCAFCCWLAAEVATPAVGVEDCCVDSILRGFYSLGSPRFIPNRKRKKKHNSPFSLWKETGEGEFKCIPQCLQLDDEEDRVEIIPRNSLSGFVFDLPAAVLR